MATRSRILAWETPWTEEPSGLQSERWQRVRHDWSDLALSSLSLALSAAAEEACSVRAHAAAAQTGISIPILSGTAKEEARSGRALCLPRCVFCQVADPRSLSLWGSPGAPGRQETFQITPALLRWALQLQDHNEKKNLFQAVPRAPVDHCIVRQQVLKRAKSIPANQGIVV